jgi:uncharacterized protein YdiU (UPF0061 family)
VPQDLAPAQPFATAAFDNSYARLPERFFTRLPPTPVSGPALVKVNRPLAEMLGLDADALASADGIAMLAGNAVPPGADPLAQVYAGHQFGGWSPRLGDGRAILLGEIVGSDGVRRDVQLKGSGRTPYSRTADGRAALGPVMREYIISEAMFALGIPTTRSLAAVTTGDTIRREAMLPGAVLTRVAQSHIRVGTFQYLYSQDDADGLRALADHVIARHYPEAAGAENPYAAMLEGILVRQAALVAQWMLVGFIHGVMNTDNMQIAGETIDYGPCAFMDEFHPGRVYSSIDQQGRYAYGNQPSIAQWNLAQLAQALLPILAESQEEALAQAQSIIDSFPKRFEAAFAEGLRAKLGLFSAEEGDLALAQSLLTAMTKGEADFTLTFRWLANVVDGAGLSIRNPRNLFNDPALFEDWLQNWAARAEREDVAPADRAAAMRAVNPLFIPRNHLVEEAIRAGEDHGDYAPMESLLAVLAHPFDDQPDAARYALPPTPEQVVPQTFCGT